MNEVIQIGSNPKANPTLTTPTLSVTVDDGQLQIDFTNEDANATGRELLRSLINDIDFATAVPGFDGSASYVDDDNGSGLWNGDKYYYFGRNTAAGYTSSAYSSVKGAPQYYPADEFSCYIAVSLVKLKSDYNGPCAQITYNGDVNQADISFDDFGVFDIISAKTIAPNGFQIKRLYRQDGNGGFLETSTYLNNYTFRALEFGKPYLKGGSNGFILSNPSELLSFSVIMLMRLNGTSGFSGLYQGINGGTLYSNTNGSQRYIRRGLESVNSDSSEDYVAEEFELWMHEHADGITNTFRNGNEIDVTSNALRASGTDDLQILAQATNASSAIDFLHYIITNPKISSLHRTTYYQKTLDFYGIPSVDAPWIQNYSTTEQTYIVTNKLWRRSVQSIQKFRGRTVHIIISWGQSNMYGYDPTNPMASDLVGPLEDVYLSFSNERDSLRAGIVENLWQGDSEGSNYSGKSAIFRFGKTFATNSNDALVNVIYAVGGTRISSSAGTSGWSASVTGGLLDELKRRVNNTLTLLGLFSDITVQIDGVINCIGTGDSTQGTTEQEYEDELNAIIAELRTEFSEPNLKFVIAKSHDFDVGSIPNKANIIQAQQDVADGDANVFAFGTTASDGYDHIGDATHYDVQSLDLMGTEFYNNLFP